MADLTSDEDKIFLRFEYLLLVYFNVRALCKISQLLIQIDNVYIQIYIHFA